MRESIGKQDGLRLEVMAAKRCSTCGLEKPVAEFVPSRPHLCRACLSKRTKEYRARLTPDQRQQLLDGMTAWQLNIPRQEIEEQRAKQCGLCAICQVPLVSGRGSSGQNADHDPETFRPRGLLCKECNRRLGLYESVLRLGPEYNAKLVAYLANPPWEFVGAVDEDKVRWRMRHRRVRWSKRPRKALPSDEKAAPKGD